MFSDVDKSTATNVQLNPTDPFMKTTTSSAPSVILTSLAWRPDPQTCLPSALFFHTALTRVNEAATGAIKKQNYSYEYHCFDNT